MAMENFKSQEKGTMKINNKSDLENQIKNTVHGTIKRYKIVKR